jgi:hypothetical protein
MSEARITNVSWRNGRPRFNPGPRTRALGFCGKDLRHPDGTWFTWDEAKEYASTVQPTMDEKRAEAKLAGRILVSAVHARMTNHSGYIYFLKSGEAIKIGFSRKPMVRASDLATGLSHGIDTMTFVPGTEREERCAHAFLARFRRAGEWFDCHPDVICVMVRSLTFGRLMLDGTERAHSGRTMRPEVGQPEMAGS